MKKIKGISLTAVVMLLFLVQIVHADPLDDAQGLAADFIYRAGLAISGLAVGVASLAIGVIAIRRKIDIATGNTDSLARHNKEIIDVLKLLAWVSASGFAAAIASSIFQ